MAPSVEMVSSQYTSLLESCISIPHLRPVIRDPLNGVVFFSVAPNKHSVPETLDTVIESDTFSGDVLLERVLIEHFLAKFCIEAISAAALVLSAIVSYTGKAKAARIPKVATVIKISTRVNPSLFPSRSVWLESNKEILSSKKALSG